jgi:hypothetical protein
MASEFEEAAETARDIIKEESLKEVEKEEPQWIGWVALSTLVMALLSALGSLTAGITANDLIIERSKEILDLSHISADRVDIQVLKSKHAILTSMGETVDSSEIEKIRNYEDEMEKAGADAAVEESQFQRAFFEHELFAMGVTMLSISITLSGISVVTRRKRAWMVGLVFAVIGTSFLGIGVYRMIS